MKIGDRVYGFRKKACDVLRLTSFDADA